MCLKLKNTLYKYRKCRSNDWFPFVRTLMQYERSSAISQISQEALALENKKRLPLVTNTQTNLKTFVE